MSDEIVTLRMARENAQVTIAAVAHWMNCHENTIYRYETGRLKPSQKALERLHEYLDFDYVTLDDVPPPPPPPLSRYRQHIQALGIETDDNGELYAVDSRLLVDWQQIDAGLARWNEMRA